MSKQTIKSFGTFYLEAIICLIEHGTVGEGIWFAWKFGKRIIEIK